MKPEIPLPAAISRGAEARTFGGYTLIDEIGRGAMGVVFTAQQHGSKRIVAIKFAHDSVAGTGEGLRRFRTEAETVAALDHPGILPIHEAGERDGVAYYTMRFAEAGSLAERLDWFADPREAAELVARISAAVGHAHERGILHRDLKPGNILLATRSEPLVADFGLARWARRESGMTASLAVLGTPDYLAPEMLRGAGENSTTAADIFSLGAILHHLLSGRAPFAGDSVAEVLQNVTECAPPLLTRVPRDLAAVCMKCLERDPAARYSTAGALAADLRSWLAGEPVIARQVGFAGRAVRLARRKPLLAGLACALTASLLALGANVAVSRHGRRLLERQRAEIAGRMADEHLHAALVARAQLCLRSHLAGDRAVSLRLLRQAWEISPSTEIRDAVISALTLPDLEEMALAPGVKFPVHNTVPPVEIQIPPRTMSRAFSLGTGRAALAGSDKVIYIADTATRTIVQRLRGLDGDCLALAFSPDGHSLASVSDDLTVRLWDVDNGHELLVLKRPRLPDKLQLRWSDDQRWLQIASGQAMRVVVPDAVQVFTSEQETARSEGVRTIDLSNDGRWLVTGDESGDRLWKRATRREVARFPKDRAEWSAARFSPDSRRLWIGGWNSSLRVADLPAVAGIPISPPVRVARLDGVLAAQSEDGSCVAALSNARGGFQFRETAPPYRETWLHQQHPLEIALSRDGKFAATGSFDAPGVRLWSLPDVRLLREIPSGNASLPAFSADGSTLASGSGTGVTFWNFATGAPTGNLTLTSPVSSLAFSPNGCLLIVETRDGVFLHRGTPPFAKLARLATSPECGSASFCFGGTSLELAVQSKAGGAVVWRLDVLERELAELGMPW